MVGVVGDGGRVQFVSSIPSLLKTINHDNLKIAVFSHIQKLGW